MQIDEPFYKVFIDTQGLKYRVVVNGIDIKNDKKLTPLKIEIPINQFVRTGENKFELQLFPFSKKGNLTKTNDDYIEIEFRLYTDLTNYVVLSKLNYSAKNVAAGKPYDGSTVEGRYSLINHKFEYDDNGEYIISELDAEVREDAYNKTFLRQQVSMQTPFPEWRFLKSDFIPGPEQFKTVEKMMKDIIRAPFNEVKKIHTALSNKDINSIMPMFKERNDEMDKAFYYKSGTYEKMLIEAFKENISKNNMLGDLIIDEAQPVVSPDGKTLKLGVDSILYFHNKSKSVYKIYEIYFRKDGDKWIITR